MAFMLFAFVRSFLTFRVLFYPGLSGAQLPALIND